MERIILCTLAVCALIGGADALLGNRFGLGERFEEGFHLLGPTALSMVGLLCLTPFFASALQYTLAPLWRAMGLDASMLGGLLAIDMGGYQTASALAENTAIGDYAGILVASTLGCTVTYTIPLGAGILRDTDASGFYRGILIGLGTMPIALLVGGMACGIRFAELLVQTIPVILFSVLVIVGIHFFKNQSIRIFSVFATLLRMLSVVGLTLAAAQSISGITLIPMLSPIEDAMQTVSGIGVVMLGSLPAAELLRRLLCKPLERLGQRLGMKNSRLEVLLVGFVSITPALATMKDLDDRGKTIIAAFSVCAASALAAHLGFTLSVKSEMLVPLLITKLFGGLLAAAMAIWMTRKDADSLQTDV